MSGKKQLTNAVPTVFKGTVCNLGKRRVAAGVLSLAEPLETAENS